ncbi:MAG: isochorismatase family protein [Myxococcota bacterium]
MPYDLTPHLDPRHCALVVFECLEGVVGPKSQIPGLARAVREGKVLEHIASLADAAREAGVRVFYCEVEKRADGVGNPFNTPLERRLRDASPQSGGPPAMGPTVAEVAPEPGDVVVAREHGLTGFHESGLDAYLRNTGTRTVVLVGVSVNVGIMGTSIEAVNRGYTVVVATDCVASDPPEYAELALRYSIRNVAFLSTSDEIAAAWRAHGR